MNRICRHFKYCGGCLFQDIPYSEQLRKKEKEIKKMIDFFSLKTELKPINHFSPWFYRNKMEFTFFPDKEKKLILGLHRKDKKRKVFDLEECLIFSEITKELLEVVKEFLKDKYPAYDKLNHTGFLRHLIVREAKFNEELMIGLVTTSLFTLDKQGFLNALRRLSFKERIKSVFWVINDRVADAVIFEKKELLWGSPFITEKIDSFNFYIFIDTFFQTNSFGINTLYKKIEEYANLTGKEFIWDLYCGVGSIGIFLAKKAKFVWGIELEEEAVKTAILNAQINNISNISFICADVKKILAQNEIPSPHIVIINPPRCGLSKKTKKRLVNLKAPLIFYSSCNPYTFFADLKDLSLIYDIKFIELFDFFPHTPHLECLAYLKLKERRKDAR